MATPEQIRENKRRQAYLASQGYRNVPQDGSWGPWQESLWNKAMSASLKDVIPSSNNQTPGLMATVLVPALTAGATGAEVGALGGPTAPISAPVAATAAFAATLGAQVYNNWDKISPVLSYYTDKVKRQYYTIKDGVISRFDNIEDREEPAAPQPPTTQENSQAAPQPSPQNKPEDEKPGDKKKDSKFKSEAKKVARNIGRGYGKVAKGAAYGVGFGAPLALGAYGTYKAFQPEPTEAEKFYNETLQMWNQEQKLAQAEKLRHRIDSLRAASSSQPSSGPSSQNLPKGFVPIVGYDSNDPNKVVTYSNSGKPDSVIVLQSPPDISRFKTK